MKVVLIMAAFIDHFVVCFKGHQEEAIGTSYGNISCRDIFLTIGVFLLVWRKRKNFYSENKKDKGSYSGYIFKKCLDVFIFLAGIAFLIIGSIFVIIQEYTDSTWLGLVVLFIVIWLEYRISIIFNRKKIFTIDP